MSGSAHEEQSEIEPLALSQQLPEKIDGPRLTLEIWHPARAAELGAAVANSINELRPWMPWIEQEPMSLEQRLELMTDGRARWRGSDGNYGDGNYTVLLNDRVIGACGLHVRQGPGILEIGYWIDSDHTGRGYATEAAQLLTEVASTHPDISVVEIHHDRGNQASAMVAAKAGFVFADQHQSPILAPGHTGTSVRHRHMTLPGFNIRSEYEDDHEIIAEVVEAAFSSPVEAQLVSDIRRSPEYVPGLALVAETDGRVVGHVMISGCVLRRADGTEVPIKMLSPLAVHPDLHRHGIGAALVKAVVDLADETGEPMVVLEGNPAYYGRFGFEPSTEHDITMSLPDWAPVEAGQVLPLANYDPALTGTVVYPKAFDGVD